ncbi:BspA family leucine-rich repeat surface protein [Candidatus Spongiihabitans sp.]|uniref:BspA family leucine-rich repeat surface protein n=1 Tax=Candidatus Spongiihabitans sp. TaxID=3101308 RepID=UPI003C6EA7F4
MLRSNLTQACRRLVALLGGVLLLGLAAQAQAEFITTWRTTTANDAITFPGEGAYTIDWGDGSAIETATGAANHTYAAAGDYDITASSAITRFHLNNGADKEKLIDIKQWGGAQWSSMENAFNGAENMRMSATDAPDLSAVGTMGGMFQEARVFNGDIGGWDVGNVEYMEGMFYSAVAFNGDISGWDVGNVEVMWVMFYGAAAFNQDIGGWNVGNVTDMRFMFNGADAFSQNLGRWYIVETLNPDYDGATDFVVLRLAAQNNILTSEIPVYALAAGDGDSGNNKFTLTDAALSAKAGTAAGDYSVRIGASGVNFGAANAVMVDVTVGAAADAALSGLMLSAGDILSPAFASDTISYTASVGNAVDSITVTPTLNDANASVTVNGAAVVSGAASGAISLAVGETEIKVVVTAEDTTTERTYTVAVTRAVDTTAFITTWRATANDAITFPGEGAYTIDWGDGSIDTATGAVNHTYAAAGDYDIAASSAITRFNLNNGADKEKLIDVKQWGGAQWSSMENAFDGAVNMRMSATDAPNLSAVGTMRDMFRDARVFNGAIGTWDVGNVTDMAGMFNGAAAFNRDIGGWDVGKVTNMSYIFIDAAAFNQDIGGWDVGKATNMAAMFDGAAAFNQDIGDWDVGNVEDMGGMFYRAAAFNQDIGGWDVGNVADMTDMFNGAAAFSQNLGRWYIVETLNPDYDGATDFVVLRLAAQNNILTSEIPVYALAAGDGDSGNNKFTLTDAALSAKAGTAAGDYSVRIGASGVNFGAANAVMVDVTVGAAADAALSGLMLSAGDILSPAFASDTISYTASVVSGAASGAISLAVGETEIKVVVTAEDTTTERTYTLVVARAIDTTTAFITTWRATANDAITFPGEGAYAIDWGDGSAIDIATGYIDHTYAAAGDYDITASSPITRFNLNNGADKEKLIDVKQWGGAQWSSMENAFHGAANMRMSATDAPNLSAVGTMSEMFRGAAAFMGESISDWDVGGVTNMAGMFSGAAAFNSAIGTWDVGNVTNMRFMFFDVAAFNRDISRWNVGNVTDMNGMFFFAKAFNGDISGWDVSNVTTMRLMFNGADAFNQDISGWKVDKVTDMNGMFAAAKVFNQDIGGWNVGNVTEMANMFNGADAFSQNLGRWYIVGTRNTDYDGADNLVVLNLAAQNSVLTGQDPVYALAAGVGDSGNNKFTLTGAALSAKAGTANGLYKVRIGASGVDFGAANAVMVDVTVVTRAIDTTTAFITTWRATANDAITFPGEGAYAIDWGDGSAIDIVTGAVNHTYAAAGDYDIAASNTITRFNLNRGEDKEKLIDVKQWGGAQWSSMENAFDGAENMRMSATDAPNLSAVGTMRDMFRDARVFNGAIGTWDVGNVTDMAGMFHGVAAFNRDIGGWYVGNVTNMSYMFFDASAFNQDIGGWDVGKATNMVYMFGGAAAFNQDIGGWYVGNVTNMAGMFNGAAAFNQNIGSWDVGNVADMTDMFNGTAAFS